MDFQPRSLPEFDLYQIFIKDPNGLMLEYAWQARALGPDDAVMQVRERLRLRGGSPVTDFRDE